MGATRKTSEFKGKCDLEATNFLHSDLILLPICNGVSHLIWRYADVYNITSNTFNPLTRHMETSYTKLYGYENTSTV